MINKNIKSKYGCDTGYYNEWVPTWQTDKQSNHWCVYSQSNKDDAASLRFPEQSSTALSISSGGTVGNIWDKLLHEGLD